MHVEYLERPGLPKLAYVHSKGVSPPVMFLGGFKSDMNGTKASWLEHRAKARGQEFLRFDYSGHGQSDGVFRDGTIGAWRNDALNMMTHIFKEPVILVGSSMGGWIGLSLLSQYPETVRGFVGIAAAPDFMDYVTIRFTPAQKEHFEEHGFVEEPNDYDSEPYVFTKAMLEDGVQQRILTRVHDALVPMCLVQGKQDSEVPWDRPEKIKQAFPKADVQITLIEDGDHRLALPDDLAIIDGYIRFLSGF